MFLIRTLLSQGTILCIVLLLVTLDVGFSTAKATTKPGKLLLVLAGCLVLFGGMELLSRGGDPAGEITAVMFLGWLGLLGTIGALASLLSRAIKVRYSPGEIKALRRAWEAPLAAGGVVAAWRRGGAFCKA